MYQYSDFEMLSARDEAYLADNSDQVVEKLYLVGKSKGIRNNDLAKLTGWNPSKVSKLLKRNQRLSTEDLKTWARCLGYTPDAFINEDVDVREYSLGNSVRSLLDLLIKMKGVQGIAENKLLKDILYYEFPLSIMNVLQVEPSDYIVSPDIKSGPKSADYQWKDVYRDDGLSVKISHRNTFFDGDEVFFEYLISPYRDYIIVGLYMCPKDNILYTETRKAVKQRLSISKKITEDFNYYANRTAAWFPEKQRYGEIISFTYNLNDLPTEERLEDDLAFVFQKYCELVYEKNGLDIGISRKGKDYKEGLNKEPYYGIINPEISKKIIRANRYKCEIDDTHVSFEDMNGNQYMVVTPLVPFSKLLEQGIEMDEELNYVCLCPNCAEQYVHGKRDDRENMVISLYRIQEQKSANKRLPFTLGQALSLNGL